MQYGEVNEEPCQELREAQPRLAKLAYRHFRPPKVLHTFSNRCNVDARLAAPRAVAPCAGQMLAFQVTPPRRHRVRVCNLNASKYTNQHELVLSFVVGAAGFARGDPWREHDAEGQVAAAAGDVRAARGMAFAEMLGGQRLESCARVPRRLPVLV